MQRVLVEAAITIVVAGCAAESSLPGVGALADGWNQVFPNGESLCSDSSAYTFFVRPASRDSVVIAFQGGGSCWRGENCSSLHNPTFAPTADERDDPSRWSGIWDVKHPENPLASYSQVLVPYCTGDLHLGDRATTYDVAATDSLPAMQVTVHHRGYANAMAVLNWVFQNFDAPHTVLVVGLSAGSAAVPFYSAVVQEEFPDAYVVALGDASGGSRGADLSPAWEAWGTAGMLSRHDGYDGITARTIRRERFYETTAREQPAVRLAQINSANDRAQLRFLRRLGVMDTLLLPLLDANEASIRRVAPIYRSFIYGGADHVILRAPAFYFVEADGKRIRDWVADLAARRDPGDVRCTVCDRPSFRFSETDLRILTRTDELLASASSWQKEDDGRCEDDEASERWSLFCALEHASHDVLGRSVRTASHAEIELRILEHTLDSNRWRSFRDYNNASETSFSDIKRLLRTVLADVDAVVGTK